MTALNQNISMFAGDDLEIKVPLLTSTGGVVSPVGLTARYAAGFPGQIVVSKTTGAGITVGIEGGTAVLTITLLAADTLSKSSRVPYIHEIEVVDSEGRSFTALRGELAVSEALIQ